MKFDDLKTFFNHVRSEWETDSKIDFQFKNKQYTADLAQVSLDIPYQHNKYLNFYMDFSTEKTALDFQYRMKLKEKREYYQGEASPEVYKEKPFGQSIKTSEKMRVYLEADQDLINIEMKIEFINKAILYLDNVLKMVSNRSFQIKNAIDWERFINGEK